MITYCTNIHPGESWSDVLKNIQTAVMAVKTAVSPDALFPIGLRLSYQAAMQIDKREAFSFREWCDRNGCYVPTINGFPFGAFHTPPVKERVYLPDWRDSLRVEYTARLADLLDLWLPDGVMGSISTVPIAFQRHFSRQDYGIVRNNLIETMEHFDRLRSKSGKKIILAIEPEPSCVIETTPGMVEFLAEMDFPASYRDIAGVCWDCCHLAVEFENPKESLSLLSQNDIPIGKVQISSALQITGENRAMLEKFVDPCYLHQVVIRKTDGSLIRYADLPEALSYPANKSDRWRIHFHVPIFWDETENYGSTRFFIQDTLPLLPEESLLEVETYTWQVLPAGLRGDCVTESIVKEIAWLESCVNPRMTKKIKPSFKMMTFKERKMSYIKWVQENVLARGSRPGYHRKIVSVQDVEEWIAQAKEMGIKTIVCLLSDQLEIYRGIGLEGNGLLEHYAKHGFDVVHYPLQDYTPVPLDILEKIYTNFDSYRKPVLVHCSAGIGRTGYVIDYLMNRWWSKRNDELLDKFSR